MDGDFRQFTKGLLGSRVGPPERREGGIVALYAAASETLPANRRPALYHPSVVISGDTAKSRNLIRTARSADLLIH